MIDMGNDAEIANSALIHIRVVYQNGVAVACGAPRTAHEPALLSGHVADRPVRFRRDDTVTYVSLCQ
jgi:hypothetical protein